MSVQSELIVVIGVGCDGAHGAGIRFGTNCACCSFEKLHWSFMGIARDIEPGSYWIANSHGVPIASSAMR